VWPAPRQRREIATAAILPEMVSGSNLAASGAVVDDGGLGKTPDIKAARVRGLQDSGLGGSAWPRRRRGPAPAAGCGVELGLWWRLRDEDAGGAARWLKGRARRGLRRGAAG